VWRAVSGSNELDLPLNLSRFHGCGCGTPLPPPHAAAVLAARIASLARGSSGVRVELVQRLCDFSNRRILPCIPEYGSVGASGDLTPLSYIAAMLVGERECWAAAAAAGGGGAGGDGVGRTGDAVAVAALPATTTAAQRRALATETACGGSGGSGGGSGRVDGPSALLDVRAVHEALQWKPLRLEPKESLAIMNGTSVMTGVGCVLWVRALRLARWCCALTACASDVTRGNPDHFDARIHALRPHAGQITAAAWIRGDLTTKGASETTREPPARLQVRCRLAGCHHTQALCTHFVQCATSPRRGHSSPLPRVMCRIVTLFAVHRTLSVCCLMRWSLRRSCWRPS